MRIPARDEFLNISVPLKLVQDTRHTLEALSGHLACLNLQISKHFPETAAGLADAVNACHELAEAYREVVRAAAKLEKEKWDTARWDLSRHPDGNMILK